jgi:hypothetical protein
MFNKTCLKALRFIALVLLLVNVTLTLPALAQTESTSNSGISPTTETLDPRSDRPNSQPSANQRMEPTSEVEQSDNNRASARTYAQPPHPYDMEAIEKFDEELYGPEH